jgi:hypothetical protein
MPLLPTIIKSLGLCLLLSSAGAHAEVMKMKIAAIKTGVGSLKNVQVEMNWPKDAKTGQLRIRAAQLDFPTLSYQAKNIDWQCPLARKNKDGWICQGKVRSNGSEAFPLSLDYSSAGTEVDLRIAEKRIRYENSTSSPDLSRIGIEKVPVAWLKAYLAQLWQQGNWTGGTLSGRIDINVPKKLPVSVDTDLQLSNVGLETPDGWLAAGAMQGRLRVNYSQRGATTTVKTRYTAQAGEFLAQGLYVLFPNTPVDIDVLMQKTGNAPWRVPSIAWRDGNVLNVRGNADLDAKSAISNLNLSIDLNDLSTARDRYLTGFLAPAGFSDLILAGAVKADIAIRNQQNHQFYVALNQVSAVDGKSRFTFAGLNGDVSWSKDSDIKTSQLTWQNGAMYGIGLGKAEFNFQSSDGVLKLTRPMAVDALEGKLGLDHFSWQPPNADVGTRFTLGLSMNKLDMASLSQRLGWPSFSGSISGKIPNARYQDNVLSLDGGLQMSVFDGQVELSNLVMERPFGVAPTLSADVVFNDINMEPMTKAFDFGSIAGSLDGRLTNLRLLDWSPVAFDAKFYTDKNWKGKRRISQRAVRDISSVAGSGLLAGLQNQVLKVFEDFGYEQIGISCKLKDNICAMDGVGSAGDGYIIVAGGGLPRIQVVGFRRKVDWPTLVSRLTAATQGDATPVVQ